MRKAALLTLGVLLTAIPLAFAQTPDPRDSVILESKSVAPGSRGEADTSAYLYVKVFITNAESLTYLTLALKEVSALYGAYGAYGILGRPRTFSGVINALTPSFRYGSALGLSGYNSSNPDSFVVGAGADGFDPNTVEPPNAIRKAVWEIKFDSVLNYEGRIELDTATVAGIHRTMFTNTTPLDKQVNFLRSVITVPFYTLIPDPRDSVIIESKAVAPNLTGSPAFAVKVYITNKDSLTCFILGLKESTIEGTAYALLNISPYGTLTFESTVTNLTNTLRYFTDTEFFDYDGRSPDRLVFLACYDGRPETIEPPNLVRKAIWELKFGHSSDSVGKVLLDSDTHLHTTAFTTTRAIDLPVNFLPGVLTVEYVKGDLSGNAALSASDVVLMLRCVFCPVCPPPPVGADECDLNCDGQSTIADVMLLLNAVFLGEPFPC